MPERNRRIPPQRQAVEWFTPKEAADHVGVHVESIYDACRARGLRHVKLGHSTIRIRRGWLDSWLEQHAR